MNRNVKRSVAGALIGVALLGGATACKSKADTVNKNLAKEADNFSVLRDTVFINGITDKYLLEVKGYCSIDTSDANRWAVTCMVGKDSYKRDYMGKADNVTMVSTQMDPVNVSAYHYELVFRPETIIPQPVIR
jgi:hypothetical protein